MRGRLGRSSFQDVFHELAVGNVLKKILLVDYVHFPICRLGDGLGPLATQSVKDGSSVLAPIHPNGLGNLALTENCQQPEDGDFD